MTYDVLIGDKSYRLELRATDNGWECKLDGQEVHLNAVMTRSEVLSILIDGTSYEVKREHTAIDTHYWVKNHRYAVDLHDPRSLRSRQSAAGIGEGPQQLVAPMPGKVIRILAQAKSEIEAGQGVVVIEAMKMQNELKSPKKGVVRQVLAKEGATVNAGDVLAIVE